MVGTTLACITMLSVIASLAIPGRTTDIGMGFDSVASVACLTQHSTPPRA